MAPDKVVPYFGSVYKPECHPKNFIPANDGTADNIVENTRIQAGFINIKLQNTANIP